jgi:hypothetical protein
MHYILLITLIPVLVGCFTVAKASESLTSTESKVERDLRIYDDHISKRRAEFAAINSDIDDKSWVKKKIAFMVEIDQFMRNYLSVPHKNNYTELEKEEFMRLFMPRSTKMDETNTRDLKKLIAVYDWFKISEFGPEIDRDAWLLVQHADHDPDFQKAVLAKLSLHWPQGETSPRNYAYLFDRVAASWSNANLRVPQRYGSQGSCVGPGKWEPIEIEDRMNVDARRKTVGLGPLAEYIKGFQTICKKKEA